MSKFVTLAIILSVVVVADRKAATNVKPLYGTTNPTPKQIAEAEVKRYGSVIELLPGKEQEYRKLHADVWPQVLATIKKAKIQNYNIFVATVDGKRYLFSYFEYKGNDPDKDLGGIADDPTTKNKWWPITDACQKRLAGTPDGKHWFDMEMVMHID